MKKFLGVVLFFCAAFALAQFTAVPESQAAVRMAYLQNDLHHLPLWVALDKGLFVKEGVDVKVAGAFHAGPELMTAFKSDSIDMGYVGEAPSTIAFARGMKNIHLVAQVNTGGSAVVVAPNSPLKSLAEMKGKRIAVPGNGTVQDFLVRRSFRKAGLAPTDVTFITISPSEMATALSRGQIDAFIAWQPFPARAVVSGQGRILADSSDMWPGHPCCGLVASDKAIASGEAAKVVKAHEAAMKFISEHPDEAIAIAVKHTGMDEKTISSYIASMSDDDLRASFRESVAEQVKSQYADFTALLERTRAKLSEASGAIDRAEQRSRAIQKSLSNVERMDTPMPSGRFDDEE